MNKLNRVHARIQEFLLEGGGGGVSRPDGQKTICFFFSPPLIIQFTEGIQWFHYRGGSNIFQEGGPTSSGGGGGVQMLISIEIHVTVIFKGGGSGPPIPSLDPHKGSPDATVMVNQNLN